MFDSLLTDPFSPWPPTLYFTPEVQSGIRAATDLEAGPGWDVDPQSLNLEDVADHIFLNDPKLLRLILQLDAEPTVECPETERNVISAA